MLDPEPKPDSRRPYAPDSRGRCYRDDQHFAETMSRVARDLMGRKRGSIERRMPIFIVVLALAFIGTVLLYGIGPGFVLIILFAVGLVFYLGQEISLVRRIEKDHLCFGCGYPLKGNRVDTQGWGHCPECGERFNDGYYRSPAPELPGWARERIED